MTGDWMTGKPMGPGAGNVGGDPAAAFGGTGVLGNNLQGGGLHAPGATAIATLPSVALAGYRNVRLQFRRWLNVDDASFDQASTCASNGAAAFANPARNATSGVENSLVAPRVFRDREWREVDFDLGDPASGLDTSKISLELKSDSSN